MTFKSPMVFKAVSTDALQCWGEAVPEELTAIPSEWVEKMYGSRFDPDILLKNVLVPRFSHILDLAYDEMKSMTPPEFQKFKHELDLSRFPALQILASFRDDMRDLVFEGRDTFDTFDSLETALDYSSAEEGDPEVIPLVTEVKTGIRSHSTFSFAYRQGLSLLIGCYSGMEKIIIITAYSRYAFDDPNKGDEDIVAMWLAFHGQYTKLVQRMKELPVLTVEMDRVF